MRYLYKNWNENVQISVVLKSVKLNTRPLFYLFNLSTQNKTYDNAKQYWKYSINCSTNTNYKFDKKTTKHIYRAGID